MVAVVWGGGAAYLIGSRVFIEVFCASGVWARSAWAQGDWASIAWAQIIIILARSELARWVVCVVVL